MTRITHISRLSGCGIFRDFRWPQDLPEFGRYNLIYGWNGTGKTTISRILRHLEKRTAPSGHVGVKVEGQEDIIKGDEFPNATVPIRVFNRDFIDESVFPVGGGDLPPIFVLGAKSVEKQKEVERLKGERSAAQSQLDSASSTKQQAERDFDQFCIDRARNIKDALRSSSRNRYNNYDKSGFKDDAEKMVQANDGSTQHLSDEEREKLRKQLLASPKDKLKEVGYSLPDFRKILDDVSRLLRTTIVSATIEVLKRDPDLAEWTRQGLELHRERKAERCLFCEQTLPKERLDALEAHFSTQYEQLIYSLDRKIDELQSLSKAVADLRLPNKAELYDYLAAEYQTAEEELRQALNAVQKFFDAAVQALQDKKRRLFEHVNLDLGVLSVDAQAVGKLNGLIRKHNQACDEFQTRASNARKRLAEDMIAEVLQEYVSKKDTLEKASAEVQAAANEIKQLEDETKKLEAEILEHRKPAEELNEDLQKYLGHDELQLEVKDTGYTIKRGYLSAQALSEGEMTAIALLYFLKSLRDRQFDLAKGVVVLDDPVSSLDLNALYLAFGFMRECTKDAGQLIILTHNFTFFRQVRNWFHHLKGQKKKDPNQRPARFYMINCRQDGGQRCSTICQLDPLLEEYESEYHYLFACIYRAASSNPLGPLQQNYVLPNMARRLLESFLAFRRPDMSGDLWEKMGTIDFDKTKKTRILRFLHTHSHRDTVGEPEHDLSILAEAGPVLKDLLELIESQDKDHYDAMVELVNRPAEEGDK
jgi:wobble nucleotide-excising tRNase